MNELAKLNECIKMLECTREALEVAREALGIARRTAMTLENQYHRQLVLKACSELKITMPSNEFPR